jgi:BirA family biotin operon repressor/biotin-[acetyl-CoA-carboxylase] ligase
MQSGGLGSRGNSWESTDDALLFSFAISLKMLPKDLKIESASIYFMYLLKELLAKRGSKSWFKWPNDIYIGDKKVGGCITSFLGAQKTLICGIGLNIKADPTYGECDIKIDKKTLLNEYLSIFSASPEWKQIFINFEVEFLKTREYAAHLSNMECLENATLNSDGSLTIEDKKVFSLR